MKKVAVYTRVSTSSEEQIHGLEYQELFFKDYINNNDNIELYKFYVDKGLTGTKLNKRPAFIEMLYDAGLDLAKGGHFEVSRRKPKFDTILTKNSSRFARNSLCWEIISKLREKQVNILFIEQNLDTGDVGSELMIKLWQLFDENYVRDLSQRVKTGVKTGAINNVVMANSRLYGYKYIQSENRLEMVEDEANVVRFIYKMYSEGFGIRRIINKLSNLGICNREGKEFCKSSIDRILTNEKYYGCNVRLKYRRPQLFTDGTTMKLNEQEKWIVHEDCDKIEPIITKELFEKCMEIRENRRGVNNQVGVYHGTSIFATKLVCAKCGKPYYSDVDRGRRFYKCATKKKYGVLKCNNPNISEKKLMEYINEEEYIGYLQGLKLVKIRKIKNEINKLNELIDEDKKEEVQAKKEELEELKKRRVRILDLHEDGIISKIELKTRIDRVSVLIKKVEDTINLLSADNDELTQRINTGYERIEEIKSIVVNDSYTFEEILQDVDKIEIDEKGNPNVYWVFDKEI